MLRVAWDPVTGADFPLLGKIQVNITYSANMTYFSLEFRHGFGAGDQTGGREEARSSALCAGVPCLSRQTEISGIDSTSPMEFA